MSLNNIPSQSTGYFNYTLNTTRCADNTLCPYANNQTCCDKGQGIVEIDYHNNEAMPSGSSDLLAALSTYYEAGVYLSIYDHDAGYHDFDSSFDHFTDDCCSYVADFFAKHSAPTIAFDRAQRRSKGRYWRWCGVKSLSGWSRALLPPPR